MFIYKTLGCKFAVKAISKFKFKIYNLKPAIKYKHVFFDLDHTLWDFDTNAKETMGELYNIFNLDDIVKKSFDDFFASYLHHNAILWERYHKGFITTEDLKWKRMQRTLLDFKIGDGEMKWEEFLQLSAFDLF